MIKRESLIRIGHFVKPHGIKGEITASLDYDIDLLALSYIVVDMDGILVPYFINTERPKSSETVLLSIDGISTEADAKEICGRDYYAGRADLDINEGPTDVGGYLSDFIGFSLLDESQSLIGNITDYDDSTDNILFIIATNSGHTIYIPVAQELIKDINPEQKTITMNLPDGILDLD